MQGNKSFTSFEQFVSSLNEQSQALSKDFAASWTESSHTLGQQFDSFVSSVMEDMEQIGIGVLPKD